MKKTIIVPLFIFAVSVVFGQTGQGNFLVSATSNLSFSSTSVDGSPDNANTLALNIGGAYFVIDNLAAGLKLSSGNTSQGDLKSTSFSVGPMARYYFAQLFLGASFQFSKQRFETDVIVQDANGTRTVLEFGYAAFVNNNIAIEPALSFTIGGGDLFDGSNTLTLGAGFTLYLP